MGIPITAAADEILRATTQRAGGAPGVVAIATDAADTFYEGASGVMQIGGTEDIAPNAVFLLASCTKAITGVTLMQLVEEGLVALDDPARNYVPEIAKIQVLDGFDANGEAILRAPTSDITLRQLMLHTAGFCYDFFSADLLRYRTERDIPSILACTFDAIQDVLLHDPGQQWTYGNSIDWVGRTVEAVRGKRLGEVMGERVFAPLEMHETGFTMTDDMLNRRVPIHLRAPDGQLVADPDIVLPQPPEMDMGGHGLYGTLGDYAKFIRMILNNGNGAAGRVLKESTVDEMCRNGLGDLQSGAWVSSNPQFANDGDFFPGLKKSWSYTFQVNDEPAPTGRPAGQLSWAGLANTYYWIDRQNGIGGIWSSQILPFQDIASYPGYVAFETAVYDSLDNLE